MVWRIWHGWTTPSNADAYEKLLKTKGLSAGQKTVDLRALKTSGQNRKTKKQRHKIAEQGA